MGVRLEGIRFSIVLSETVHKEGCPLGSMFKLDLMRFLCGFNEITHNVSSILPYWHRAGAQEMFS